jgi:hypothetical protein
MLRAREIKHRLWGLLALWPAAVGVAVSLAHPKDVNGVVVWAFPLVVCGAAWAAALTSRPLHMPASVGIVAGVIALCSLLGHALILRHLLVEPWTVSKWNQLDLGLWMTHLASMAGVAVAISCFSANAQAPRSPTGDAIAVVLGGMCGVLMTPTPFNWHWPDSELSRFSGLILTPTVPLLIVSHVFAPALDRVSLFLWGKRAALLGIVLVASGRLIERGSHDQTTELPIVNDRAWVVSRWLLLVGLAVVLLSAATAGAGLARREGDPS